MSVFSERINLLMNQYHLTQKQLADKAKVTEAAMSYYVKGERTPRSDVLGRIAKALDTTTDYLLGNSNDLTDQSSEQLQYLQRNLGKLDANQLKKAENILKAVFDGIFNDEDDEEDN